MSRKAVKGPDLREWQQLNEKVPDGRLYEHLVRLAVLAHRLEPQFNRPPSPIRQSHRRNDSNGSLLGVPGSRPPPRIQAKLPKTALKSLVKHLNEEAMRTTEPGDFSQLRRSSYLAFYALVLNAKQSDRESYEDMKTKPEALIMRFLSCANKQLLNYPQLPPVKTANDLSIDFLDLLTKIVKQEKGGSALISQLDDYKQQWTGTASNLPVTAGTGTSAQPSQTPQTPAFSIQQMEVAQQVAKVMMIPTSMIQTDINAAKDAVTEQAVRQELLTLAANLRQHDQHPIYDKTDFGAAWPDFKSYETTALEAMLPNAGDPLAAAASQLSLEPVRFLPADPKSYYALLVKRCLELDKGQSNLLSNQSNKLLNLAATWWRISPETRASLIIHIVREKFAETGNLEVVNAAFLLATHMPKSSANPKEWPRADYALVKYNLSELKRLVLLKLEGILKQLFEAKVPKMGPYLQLLQEYLLEFVESSLSESQIAQLRKAIDSSAVGDYDRLLAKVPRDYSLEFVDIQQLGESIVANAQKLQKKYKQPLLDKLPIAKQVCAKQLKLFSVDFVPIFEHCVSAYASRSETPAFEDVVGLYRLLDEARDLYEQVSISDGFQFNAEKLLYPFMIKWAEDSVAIAQSWVEPAIEQDTFQPLDLEAGILHSSSVTDIFNSFYASLKVVEDVHWRNQYHMAKILTHLIDGMSNALGTYMFKLYLLFCQEMRTADKQQAPAAYQTRQERWLQMAKDAVQQQQQRVAPAPFQFQTESCVRVNDIDKAYELFSKMEESLHSDAISKRIEVEEKKNKAPINAVSYLFTVSIVSARGLAPNESKGTRDTYATLIDQENRKQLGKTLVVHDTLDPQWKQQLEIEMTARPKLLKITVWDEMIGTNHDLVGRTVVKLDPKEFGGREYGTLSKWLDLDSQGQVRVDISVDIQKDDIRFYFGKALRGLKRTKDDMIQMIVEQFTPFIRATISTQTIGTLLNKGRFGMDTFQSWLGKPAEVKQPLTTEQIEDSLEPLFDYLNSNFATLATVLTHDLRIEVMSKTWEVLLDTIDGLLLPPLEPRKTSQQQLGSKEVEIVFVWLASLRDFFHNDGAGPDIQTLQGAKYQQLMSISNHYSESTASLKDESDKLHRTNIRAFSQTSDLVQRAQSCMFHRSRSVFQQHREQLRTAQLASLPIDDVILRILRARGEITFIDKHLRYRERMALKQQTERTLQSFHA